MLKTLLTIALLASMGCQSVAPVYNTIDDDGSFIVTQSFGKDILCTKDSHTRQWGGFRCFYITGKLNPEGWKEAIPTIDVRL